MCLLEDNFILGVDVEKIDLIYIYCGNVVGRECLIIEWICL